MAAEDDRFVSFFLAAGPPSPEGPHDSPSALQYKRWHARQLRAADAFATEIEVKSDGSAHVISDDEDDAADSHGESMQDDSSSLGLALSPEYSPSWTSSQVCRHFEASDCEAENCALTALADTTSHSQDASMGEEPSHLPESLPSVEEMELTDFESETDPVERALARDSMQHMSHELGREDIGCSQGPQEEPSSSSTVLRRRGYDFAGLHAAAAASASVRSATKYGRCPKCQARASFVFLDT